ncbi:MAG: hypothetical protein M1819_000845 [Sarea resinae]|nr:MAG: hypothetical protein M1819_000845 [Sarea resinae]
MSQEAPDILVGDVMELDHGDGEVVAHENSEGMPPDTKDSPQSSNENLTASIRGRSSEVAVELPLVDKPHDYQSFPEEITVQKVLREEEDAGKLFYLTRFRDRHIEHVSFDRLVNLTGGLSALDAFNQTSQSQQLSDEGMSSSEESDPMEPPRQGRARPIGLIEFSSDDDDLNMAVPNPKKKPLRSSMSRQQRSNSLKSLSGSRSSTNSESAAQPKTRASTRATRSTGATTRTRPSYAEAPIESSDEDLRGAKRRRQRKRRQSSGSDNFPIVESDILPNSDSRLRKRNKGSSRRSVPETQLTGGLLMEAAGSRRSTRTGRPIKSMIERGEDEIFASDDEDDETVRKAVGAREIFKELPQDNEFLLVHTKHCDSCGKFGGSQSNKLIHCQGCSLSYHKNCLGPRNQREHLVTKVGEGDFVLQCRRCICFVLKKDPTAPKQDICQVCKEIGPACEPFRERKTAREEEKDREENGGEDPIVEVEEKLLNNPRNVLFRCMHCWRGFHFSHLPPRGPDGRLDVDDAPGIEARRLQEYREDWQCSDCVQNPSKIASLVAWRPTNENYIPGFSSEMVIEDEKEYLIKWDGLSYYRTTWMPGAWVWGVTAAAMRKAFARRENGYNMPKMTTEEAIPEEYLRIDIVFDVRYAIPTRDTIEEDEKDRIKDVDRVYVKFKGLGYEETVWEDPPKPEDEERFADFAAAYNNWVSGRHIHLPKPHQLKERLEKLRERNFEGEVMKKTQPAGLTGGKLMDYQMEGLNWMLYNWYKRQNAILADEMGLGKTIQVIGFMATLIQDHECFPFLVVVPNSTCPNWRREIMTWAPSLRVVTYFGSSTARDLAFDYELFPGGKKALKCHIVVTSYETASDMSCRKFFRAVPWVGLIVDEGQRLKNDQNLLYASLDALKIPFKMLLTGTPLQNNARELFNLLQFLDNNMDAAALEEKYAVLTKENVQQLHELIRPFFLRRTKLQVLKFLPPMAQIIIPVTMTVLQKKLYKSILAKNPDLIKAILGRGRSLKQSERSNLNNLLMQLRKCLCHPFIFNQAIEERSLDPVISYRNLVEASPKLKLLEIMLPKLRERGHRILIFSQFLGMLDLMEDFLLGLQLPYQRLDGSINSLQKQKRIDAFNAPKSELFAFLLSTRAGGVGINLATADTVIIMDPDFNPHQDIQALSRAHRIGQEKKVLVFQLMTRDSAEEKIIQIGRKKMALDHVLIEQMDAEDDADLDLESIIRHGATALFDGDNERDIHYDSASVDKLLDRSQAESTQSGDDSAESQFSFARVWANEQASLEEGLADSEEVEDDQGPSSTVWDQILKERERAAAEEAAARMEVLGRGKRKRQTVDYSAHEMRSSEKHLASDSDSDTDFQQKAVESEPEESAEEPDGDVVLDELKPLPFAPPRGIAASQQAQSFSRARVPPMQNVTNPPSSANAIPATKGPPTRPFCYACNTVHAPGWCPLKLGGVEHCGLCGLAHYGEGRTCPHINSETQVRLMLEALKHSPEPEHLRHAAIKYLTGVKGHLAVRNRKNRAIASDATHAHGAHGVVNASAVNVSAAGMRPSQFLNHIQQPLQVGGVHPDPHAQPRGPHQALIGPDGRVRFTSDFNAQSFALNSTATPRMATTGTPISSPYFTNGVLPSNNQGPDQSKEGRERQV